MPGLTPNLDDPAEKPWTVYWFSNDPHAMSRESEFIGLFYATTAEEAITLACEEESILTAYDLDCLTAHLAWLIPRTQSEKQQFFLNMPDPPF